MHGISNIAAYRNRGIFIESINSAAFLDINTEIIRLQTFCRKSKNDIIQFAHQYVIHVHHYTVFRKNRRLNIFLSTSSPNVHRSKLFFGKLLLKTRPKEQN